eukprot:scaffold3036_cov414-Prasinococcus_capsulatus_cf.AAC.25
MALLGLRHCAALRGARPGRGERTRRPESKYGAGPREPVGMSLRACASPRPPLAWPTCDVAPLPLPPGFTGAQGFRAVGVLTPRLYWSKGGLARVAGPAPAGGGSQWGGLKCDLDRCNIPHPCRTATARWRNRRASRRLRSSPWAEICPATAAIYSLSEDSYPPFGRRATGAGGPAACRPRAVRSRSSSSPSERPAAARRLPVDTRGRWRQRPADHCLRCV